ncbi:hypothetical protein G9A89_023126 [Geosiphon pyriformis]|nr:hypothetical protein G9A89_023126 [Geosiphon pyriformis]
MPSFNQSSSPYSSTEVNFDVLQNNNSHHHSHHHHHHHHPKNQHRLKCNKTAPLQNSSLAKKTILLSKTKDLNVHNVNSKDGVSSKNLSTNRITYDWEKRLRTQQHSKIHQPSPPRQPSGFLKNDNRFWEFKIKGDTITYVRYGYLKADGSLEERAIQKQVHTNSVSARRFIEKLLDLKISTGYVGWTHW